MEETPEKNNQENTDDSRSQFLILIRQLAILIAVVVLFVVLIFVALRVYTRHGQNVSVPELRRLSLTEVKKICDERGLKFEISDSVYSSNAAPGTVIDQTPPATFKVKKERTIFLTIKAYSVEQVAMPRLIDLSIKSAQAQLATVGLGVGKISYKPDIARDAVIEQMFNGKPIPAGTRVAKGSLIDLVLGKGEDEGITKTVVPDLKSYSLYTAGLVAAQNSLNIGAKIGDGTVKTQADSLSAVIYKQSPAKGRMVLPGSEIDVWITTDQSKLNNTESVSDDSNNQPSQSDEESLDDF
ncbi:MAG: PASTA domain-containing protein [Bacteroidales bacterium]|nr:PASTA domain-containing protein [Bacteroidales bacterium]MBR2888241.1 PASTA domain-containing protein [Bacteroidales bacterium]